MHYLVCTSSYNAHLPSLVTGVHPRRAVVHRTRRPNGWHYAPSKYTVQEASRLTGKLGLWGLIAEGSLQETYSFSKADHHKCPCCLRTRVPGEEPRAAPGHPTSTARALKGFSLYLEGS